jgi:Cytochrome P460
MRTALIAVVTMALVPSIAGDRAISDAPQFRGHSLIQPTGYDRWPIVGASLGLSYAASVEGTEPGAFHRIYMNPSAYEAFHRTRTFPEGTTFVLEIHEAAENTSLGRGGFFEGKRMALEASVKDSKRFPSGWAYFGFANGALATASANAESRCHVCHVKHGQIDSVFVQFYPNLRSRRPEL